jgi:hypothetical protein
MKNDAFLGTYFDREGVLKLAAALNIFSWVLLGLYGLQLLVSIGGFIMQGVNGYLAGMAFTDYVQSLILLIEQPIPGFIYFIGLQAAGKAFLIFLEIEHNTRRVGLQTNLREK